MSVRPLVHQVVMVTPDMRYQFISLITDRLARGEERGPHRRPIIVANPAGDGQFRTVIDAFLLSGGREPRDLEAALRMRYPLAVVRPRELADEQVDVWYVYRDGHWIRSEDDASV